MKTNYCLILLICLVVNLSIGFCLGLSDQDNFFANEITENSFTYIIPEHERITKRSLNFNKNHGGNRNNNIIYYYTPISITFLERNYSIRYSDCFFNKKNKHIIRNFNKGENNFFLQINTNHSLDISNINNLKWRFNINQKKYLINPSYKFKIPSLNQLSNNNYYKIDPFRGLTFYLNGLKYLLVSLNITTNLDSNSSYQKTLLVLNQLDSNINNNLILLNNKRDFNRYCKNYKVDDNNNSFDDEYNIEYSSNYNNPVDILYNINEFKFHDIMISYN
ncbi:uncharacterized protein ASCRUDRAFT_8714 [Ascoidea rubescens DSM 1968]|uniref:Uncharacterized protein n=1 Tax=Ascoidea rubescens DSM 1968 TaxID=1344418 RepID=A0A1D2VFR7_9ASCO|nr:hypothetical protein ASCRUDRAFT_8714 [Ascoidea rubescens DSM 1968]ODV60501.1 hypothetical protein ASCRUDRAFT_8714 [Ascoidea rubescens DSM 1968]